MPYLIDGNNLCGAARDRRLALPRDEPEMLRALSGFAEGRSAWLTVVFDGPASPRRPGGIARGAGRVRLVHSGRGRSADDCIVEIARRSAAPADLTVVTSDRDLASRVRTLGCRVIGCRAFAETLHRAADSRRRRADEGTEKPQPGDVEEWERWFRGGR